ADSAPPHYDQWRSFTTADGLPSDKVMCILAAGDDVWAGTDHGLARYHRGKWQVFSSAEGLAHDGVLSLAQDQETGDLWIGTMRGLSRYSAGRFETYTQLTSGLVNDVVYGVAAHRGAIWAATAAGTSRYEIAPDRWSIYDHTNAPMHEIWCYSVTGAQDKVYLGVWGGGLLEYQIERDHWKKYRDPDGEMEIDLFLNDGLIHDIIASVAYDDAGRVWAGTYFGLSSYDGRKWRNFMDHDSPLISNFINFVRAHGEFCWIATDDGLNATDRENWWSYRRDPASGMGNVTWQPAAGAARQIVTESIFPHNYILGIDFQGGDIWLATEKGVAWGRLSTPRTAGVDRVRSHGSALGGVGVSERRQSGLRLETTAGNK
ncbi:MAG: ligand-binding sensor domain-containing protein, partial [Planctomycetota bacterium]